MCVCVSRALFSGCDVSHNNRHTKSVAARQGPTLSACVRSLPLLRYWSSSRCSWVCHAGTARKPPPGGGRRSESVKIQRKAPSPSPAPAPPPSLCTFACTFLGLLFFWPSPLRRSLASSLQDWLSLLIVRRQPARPLTNCPAWLVCPPPR